MATLAPYDPALKAMAKSLSEEFVSQTVTGAKIAGLGVRVEFLLSTKRQTPNTKHQTPNTKHQALNAKREALSPNRGGNQQRVAVRQITSSPNPTLTLRVCLFDRIRKLTTFLKSLSEECVVQTVTGAKIAGLLPLLCYSQA